MSIIWTCRFPLTGKHSTRDACEACRKKSRVRDLSGSYSRENCSYRVGLDPGEATVFPKEERL